MRKIELIVFVFLIVIATMLTKKLEKMMQEQEVSQSVDFSKEKKNKEQFKVLLDAGHGGEDPGKVGVCDYLEKDINLKIAMLLKEKLEEQNVQVVMTREKDEMLSGETGDRGKVADMKERVRLINQAKPQLAVSIHQNSYHDSQVHGAQVFYYTESKNGERAAAILQEKLKTVDTSNTRMSKANNTYYVLRRTEVPTVIVECGFLSNENEANLLVTEEYQEKLATAMMEGILGYLEDTDLYAQF